MKQLMRMQKFAVLVANSDGIDNDDFDAAENLESSLNNLVAGIGTKGGIKDVKLTAVPWGEENSRTTLFALVSYEVDTEMEVDIPDIERDTEVD